MALKNTLRQAPDVILIGEMRVRDTMRVRHQACPDRPPGARNPAYHQRGPDDRTIHRELPPRGPARAAADGPVAQHPRHGRAAADPARGRQGPHRRDGSDAEHAADRRPDLPRRGHRHQGDHGQVEPARHEDLRPGAVTSCSRPASISYEEALRNADSKNEIRLRIKLESKRADKSHLDESGALKILEEEE